MTTVRHLRRTPSFGGIAMSGCLFAGIVVGCGAEGTTEPVAEHSTTQATPSPAAKARARAVGIVEQLRAAGLPVRSMVACRPPAPAPAGHPRPRAAAFADARVTPRITGVHVVAAGGVVEVHESAQDVGRRIRELDLQSHRAQEYGFDEGGHALATEYRFRSGAALLRLSGDLARREARAYAVALREAVTRRAVTTSLDPSVLERTEEAPCST